MPQQDGPRLDGRAGVVWREYLAGRSQAVIAEDFGISQQRVSQIINKVRSTVDDRDRSAYAVLDMERLTLLMNAQMPAAMEGDVGAARVVLAGLARRAKMLGLDAAEPLRVTLERDLDGAGELVGEVLGMALDAAQLTEEQRQAALYAARVALLRAAGEEPPPPPPVPVPVVEVPADPRAGLEARMRERFADEPGVDVDALLAEVAEEGDGRG